MAFQFDPTDGLLNGNVFPTVPESETAARQQFQTLLNQIRDAINAHLADFNHLKQSHETHLAETAPHLIVVTRDISLTGIQSISTPIKPKKLTIYSITDGSKRWGVGFWANNVQRGVYQAASDGFMRAESACVIIAESITNINRGTIQNVTDQGFEINWVRTGSLTGTVAMYILIN